MGKFRFLETGISGLTVVEPTVYGDDRGYFLETWSKREFTSAGLDVDYVQDNQSFSRKGVLRGLHFQREQPQGKLVRALSGSVWDVAVDIRKGSPTFGRWYGVELSAENKRQFYIPEGFAHGFLVLSETAEFCYKCTRFYEPADEDGIHWDDPNLAIAWPLNGGMPQLSEKDLDWPSWHKHPYINRKQ